MSISPDRVEEIRDRLHTYAPPKNLAPTPTDLIGTYFPHSNMCVVRVGPENPEEPESDGYAEFIGSAASDMSDLLESYDTHIRKLKAVRSLCEDLFEKSGPGVQVSLDSIVNSLNEALDS